MGHKKIVEALPIRDQVANIVRRRIIAGELKSGEMIHERHISDELGVSTTPVKEAFRVLATEGLLETIPRKGSIVSKKAGQNIMQISYIRSALEGVAALFAAELITEAGMKALDTALAGARKCIQSGDQEELKKCNAAFHSAIRQATGNKYLLILLDSVNSVDIAVRSVAAQKGTEEQLRDFHDHSAIAEAIKARDGLKAEQLMIGHVRYGIERLTKR